MKNYLKTASIAFLSAILFFTSCKKKEDNPGGANSRVVKYEITGNFTGKLIVIYNDNVTGNTVVSNVTLPFTKEITYPANVTGIGIGAQGSTAGTPGQTATMNVYSDGKVVKTTSAVAGAAGELALPTIAYTF